MNLAKLNEEVKTDEMVVVDFYQNDCKYCEMIAPQLEEAADTTGVKLVKINLSEIDEADADELVKEFVLMSAPTIAIFKNGVITFRFTGYRPAAAIEAAIQAI